MPQYKSYPTAKDTQNRMNRKRARKETFLYNKYKAKKDTRKRLEEEREKKQTTED